jgi:hypothetical protein
VRCSLTDPRPSVRPVAVKLCNGLKKGGMYTVSSVLVGAFDAVAVKCDDIFRAWTKLLAKSGPFARSRLRRPTPAERCRAEMKAFANVVPAPTLLDGGRTALFSAGMGAMVRIANLPARFLALAQRASAFRAAPQHGGDRLEGVREVRAPPSLPIRLTRWPRPVARALTARPATRTASTTRTPRRNRLSTSSRTTLPRLRGPCLQQPTARTVHHPSVAPAALSRWRATPVAA